MEDKGCSYHSIDNANSRSSFSICGYWGARRETAGQCAARALPFLLGFGEVDPAFREWFELLEPRKPKTRVALTIEDLDDAFARGVNRRDTDRTVIHELGFHVPLWNGREKPENALVNIDCGTFSSSKILNTCIISDFHSSGTLLQRVLTTDKLTQILTLMAQHFDIDWGLATWYELREALDEPIGHPGVGWLTYFSSRFRPIPPLPPPTRLVPVDGLGSIIVLTDERFYADRADHFELAKDVVKDLRRARVLLC